MTSENICLRTINIIFVKTHKTASSTVQNVFFRFGSKHELTFGLPRNNGNRFSYPRPFTAEMIKPIENKKINVITNHLRASDDLKKGLKLFWRRFLKWPKIWFLNGELYIILKACLEMGAFGGFFNHWPNWFFIDVEITKFKNYHY